MKHWSKNLNFKKILYIFLIFRLLDFVVVYIAHYTIPYLGFFPMRRDILSFNLPFFLTNLANFDGVHYLNIARWGYSMYEQAFFPLYPLLISLFSTIVQNHLIAGLILSNISLLLGIYILYLFLKGYLSDEKVFWIIIFLISFPTSFYFGAVYTESLFLFMSAGYLYFSKKENSLLAFIFGVASSLTRLSGIFLIIPAFFILAKDKKLPDIRHNILILLSPVIGLLIYSVYLFKTVGDPLFFYHSLPAFGVNKSDNIILLPQVIFRYIKIFTTLDFNFQYFIAIIEFVVFLSILLSLIYYFLKQKEALKKNFAFLGLIIFSVIQIVLPTLTGSFSGIPRYALFAFSFFIILALVKNSFVKILVFAIFLVFHIILLGFFSQGYFIS